MDLDFASYVVLTVEVRLKSGDIIEYTRDENPENRGYLSINEYELKKIKNIKELIASVEDGGILHLYYDRIDVSRFCNVLIEANGIDFTPDPEKEWYSFDPNYGMDGETLDLFWDSYLVDRKKRERFVEKLKNIEDDLMIEEVVASKVYESFGYELDDEHEKEEYIIKFNP